VSEYFVFFLVFVGLGFFFGFIAGIYFVLSGGVYVNEYGAVDFRWPPGPRKRL
jgi:hypothetical protein